jgi:hypothetical protein
MSTATKSRPRVKPERKVRLVRPIRNGFGIVRITAGTLSSLYCVRPLDTEFGIAYRLIKEDVVTVNGEQHLEIQDVYDVLLDGERSTCECKGFLHRGRCKHLDGLKTLRQRNLI